MYRDLPAPAPFYTGSLYAGCQEFRVGPCGKRSEVERALFDLRRMLERQGERPGALQVEKVSPPRPRLYLGAEWGRFDAAQVERKF